MTDLTDYFEDAIIQRFLRADADTLGVIATIYLALSTTLPTEAGGNITEPIAQGYAREAVAFDDPAGTGATANSALEEFTAAGGSWGSIGWVVLFDAITAGNALMYSAMTAAKTVDDGDTLSFAIGDIDVTFD